jgi:integrase
VNGAVSVESIALKRDARWRTARSGDETEGADYVCCTPTSFVALVASPNGVEVSKELRRILIERRDAAMLKAFERGEDDLLPLVFPSETGGPLDGVNVYQRDLLPRLQAAGIRRVTFHALGHSYASLLIQAGAS